VGGAPELEWLTGFTTKRQTNGKGGSILPLGLSYDNGVLLATGHFTGFLGTGDSPEDNFLSNDIETGEDYSPQLGFILKYDASDGALTGSVSEPNGGVGNHVRSAAYREGRVHYYGTSLGSLWYASYDDTFSDYKYDALATIYNATATEAFFREDGVIILGKGKNSPVITGAPPVFSENSPEGLSALILFFAVDGLKKPGGNYIKVVCDKFTVHSLEGALGFAGDTGDFAVFNLAGRLVYSGRFVGGGTVSLPSGVYIVRSGGRSVKAVVL
jgi:hypothetical protein